MLVRAYLRQITAFPLHPLKACIKQVVDTVLLQITPFSSQRHETMCHLLSQQSSQMYDTICLLLHQHKQVSCKSSKTLFCNRQAVLQICCTTALMLGLSLHRTCICHLEVLQELWPHKMLLSGLKMLVGYCTSLCAALRAGILLIMWQLCSFLNKSWAAALALKSTFILDLTHSRESAVMQHGKAEIGLLFRQPPWHGSSLNALLHSNLQHFRALQQLSCKPLCHSMPCFLMYLHSISIQQCLCPSHFHQGHQLRLVLHFTHQQH